MSVESVKALFEANKGEVSGVILEGVVGNSGFIVPDKEFLTELRKVLPTPSSLLARVTSPLVLVAVAVFAATLLLLHMRFHMARSARLRIAARLPW